MAVSTGIEIVVRDCAAEQVLVWLEAVAGPLTEPLDGGGGEVVYGTRLGTLIVQPNMEGPGGIGVWFKTAVLPWATPAACARQAARELNCVVWCEPGEDYPEVPPLSPVFLEVGGDRELLFEPPET
ncbi:hypothetical protein [Zavarzinella formosa]|uniref:hypothetical protein n=1 Tax=Zavarzinella formosa TaxID=360055 RepID=UPI0002F58781|nr:hypothetical protein [Zavarzinella formosa]